MKRDIEVFDYKESLYEKKSKIFELKQNEVGKNKIQTFSLNRPNVFILNNADKIDLFKNIASTVRVNATYESPEQLEILFHSINIKEEQFIRKYEKGIVNTDLRIFDYEF